MKKLITLLLLFTLVGFLSGNQVVITNDYQYIITTEATYNFNNGSESNNVKYDRTNKIAIQNNKVIANPLNYHYAFFWDEANSFIGYYKTNKGIATNGAYIGQVNTQSIPIPLNAYSFALVRYDNDYELVNGFTIEELFIDNNLADVDPDDFNDIPIAELNGLTLNELFIDNNIVLNGSFTGSTNWTLNSTSIVSNQLSFDNTLGHTTIQTGLSIAAGTSFYTRFVARKTTVDIPRIYAALFLNTTSATTTLFENIISTDTFATYSSIQTTSTTANRIQIGRFNTVGSGLLDNLYIINTTALGLTSLTKAKLDTYFNIWQNAVNATYYATDGNVSSVDGYYYAAGKNLLDINDTTINFYVDYSSGNLFANNNYVVSNFINIKNLTYYFTNANLNIAFYDSSFTFISTTLGTGSDLSFYKLAPNNSKYVRVSILKNQIINGVQVEQGSTATAFEAFATPTTTLNLTFLFGIGNEPNKATMDGYYQDYEDWQDYSFILPLAFNTQTISFETIYFDDGVSTEIEKLGSILIFTLIGFTLMIFGFASKRRIFNLLSIGAFIVLGVLLAEFAGFLIIVFGLVVLNLYYTFLGDI
jgi:hypothetical protein